VKKEALKELGRLSRNESGGCRLWPDAQLRRVGWRCWPWSKDLAGEVDILKAKEFLDEDHYGLKKVKDRILDYLSDGV